MEPTRLINAFSPSKPETLTVHSVHVAVGGDGVYARPVSESFSYDPSTMTGGIYLEGVVAQGTVPAVYLCGLRLVMRAPGDATGGDFTLYMGVSPVDGDMANAIVFVGDNYALHPGDDIIVDYWAQEG